MILAMVIPSISPLLSSVRKAALKNNQENIKKGLDKYLCLVYTKPCQEKAKQNQAHGNAALLSIFLGGTINLLQFRYKVKNYFRVAKKNIYMQRRDLATFNFTISVDR